MVYLLSNVSQTATAVITVIMIARGNCAIAIKAAFFIVVRNFVQNLDRYGKTN